MAHPEILLTLPSIEDPVERFVAVTKFYLCGWHIKPPYVSRCSLNWNYMELTVSQRRKEAAQPDTRRDVHRLVGIPRQNKRLLRFRTDLASPSQVQLLLHGSRTQHTDRRDTEAAKQVFGKFCCKFNGRNCRATILEP
jgi:hypothetical protein